MMTEFIWSTIEWNNKIQYYNVNEDSYYCEECAYSYFNENEFEKVGSINIIKQVMKLNQNLLYKVQNYAKEEKLAIKWRTELEQFKIFYDELAKANKDLESSLKARRLNNLQFIQTRSTNLKSICKGE